MLPETGDPKHQCREIEELMVQVENRSHELAAAVGLGSDSWSLHVPENDPRGGILQSR